MNSHTIEYLSPQVLKPRARAWRKYSREQLDTACKLLENNGGLVVEPPLLDSENRVVCGGAIVLAAQKLGLEAIPILRVNSMSPEELRLYAINAHKLTDMGSYDDLLLAEELRELEKLLGEEGLKILAIAEGELTRLLGLDGSTVEEKTIDGADEGEPITRPGDVWKMERHRLLCGDALNEASFAALMVGELAQFGLTDMPYNLKMKDISSNPDREEFAFAHGEMSPNEFTRFQTTFMRHMKEWSEPGSLHAFFMSYHFLPETFRAGMIVFGRPKAMCTWIKGQPGQGSLYRSQTEQVLFFRNGDAAHRNNINLGKHGRNRSTAWHYDGMTTASAERDELLRYHATPKSVPLLKDAILDVTSRGGIVLDPFAGIGSIFLAAHSAERRAFGIEIEPRFIDVAIRRMRSAFGIDAIRESDGLSFSELEGSREVQP